jgi:rRNA maturation protein Rpf1
MNLNDLIGRINQSSAKVVFIVSTHKGNPGTLQILDPHGTSLFDIRIKSALLRRETPQNGRNRINKLSLVAAEEGTDANVKEFAQFIADLVGAKFKTFSKELEAPQGRENESVMIFEQEKHTVNWTSHTADTLEELGPRIKISSIRRTSADS